MSAWYSRFGRRLTSARNRSDRKGRGRAASRSLLRGVTALAFEPLEERRLLAVVTLDADADPGNPADNGTADIFRLVLNGSDLEAYVNGNLVSSQPFAGVTAIAVNGSTDADTLTVDHSAGLIDVTITYVGGGQPAGAGDALAVVGNGIGGTNDAVYTPDVAVQGNGVVAVDGATAVVNFSGLEPVDITAMATATLLLPGLNDTLDIINGTDFTMPAVIPALVVSGMSGATMIEDVAFFGNGTVLIDTAAVADGDDTVTITSASNLHGNTNLTISTGAGTDLVDVNGTIANLTGNLTITTQQINLDGGSITTGGNQSYNAPVTLGVDTTLDSVGGNISFAGAINGNARDLTLAAGIGAGTTTFTGNVTNLGDGTGAALTIQTGVTGLVRFQGTVAANSGLVAQAATSNVRFDQDVTLANGDTATSLPGAVRLAGLTFSGFDGLTFGAVTLSSADVLLNSNGGNIQIDSIAGGGVDLTLQAGIGAGTTTVLGNVTNLGDGTGAALTIETGVTGLVRFQGTVTANSGLVAQANTSNVRFDQDVTLADGDTATSLPGAVRLAGLTFSGFDGLTFGAVTLSAADVLLNSNGGNIQLDSIAGGGVDLTLQAGIGAGTTTVLGNVTNLGDGAGAALTIATGVTGLVRFQGTVAANSGLVAQAATSSVRFDQDVTLANGDTSTSLSGAVRLAGLTFSGFDGLTFGAVTLSSADVLLNSNGGNIQIGSIAGGGVDLTLQAGIAAGTTTVLGNVTNLGDGTGAALTIENGVTGLVRFQGTVAANSGLVAQAATSSVRFDQDVTLANGDTATGLPGAVQFDGLTFSGFDGLTFGAVTLSTADVLLNSNGGNILIDSIVGGARDLILQAGIGAGTTTVTGNVTNLGDGTGAALTIETGVTGLVRFQGTVGANSGLVAAAATSNVRFDQDVTLANGDTGTSLPGAVRLAGLTFSGFDGLTFGAATLSSADVLLNSNGGNIQIDSIAGGGVDLILQAGIGAGTTTVLGNVTNLGDGTGAALMIETGVTGLVRLQGTVAANSGLAAASATSNVRFDQDVTLANGDTGTSLPGAVQLDGLTFSGFDGLTFGAVTLSSADVRLNSNGGNIQIDSIAGGGVDLILQAGIGAGTTTVLGNVTNLGDGTGAALTIETGVTGLVRFQGTVGANSGLVAQAATSSVRFDQDVTLANGDTGTSLPGAVRLAGLTFSGFDGLTFGAVTLSSADVLLNSNGGNIQIDSIAGGGVDLTLQAGIGAGTTTVLGNVTNLGDGTGAALTIETGVTGLVRFQGTVAANSGLVAAAATSSVRFDQDVTLADGDTGTSLPGAVRLDGLTFSGFDGLTFGAVTLSTADVLLNSNGGNIQIGSIAGGAVDLTLQAGIGAGTTIVVGNVTSLGDGNGAALLIESGVTGLVRFQGTVGANSGLVAAAATSNVRFDQDVTLANGDTATSLPGAVQLDGLTFSGFDGLTFGAVVLSGGDVSLNSNGGNIQIGSITGAQDLRLLAGIAAGTTTVTGNVTNLGDGAGAALTIEAGVTGLVRFMGPVTGNSGLVAQAATSSVRFDQDVTLDDGDTATSLPGAVRLAGLTFSGFDGLTFGVVTLSSADVALNSNGGNIQINSIAGGGVDLILQAGIGAGTTTVLGNVTNLGDGTGAALTIETGVTGLVRFQGTVAANSGLVAQAATSSVRFDQDVTLADGDTATSLPGAVRLAGLTFSGFDGLTFGAVTLSSADVLLNSNGGNIQIDSIAGGGVDLILQAGIGAGSTTVLGNVDDLGDGTGAALTIETGVTGLVRFQGTVAANSGLVAAAATSSVRFDQDVTLADGDTGTSLPGAVRLDGLTFSGFDGLTFGAVTLSGGDVALNSNGGNIQIGSIAGGGVDLILQAGIGAGTTTVLGNVTNLGDGSGAALTIENGVTGLVRFQGTVGANSGVVAQAPTSNIRFDQNVTLANGDTGTSLPGAVQLDGLTFSGFDGLTFGTVTVSTSDVALNSNASNIQAGSLAGAVDLTLLAGIGSGSTTVLGNVSNLGDGAGAALTLQNGVTGLARVMGTVTANSGLVAEANTSNVRFDNNVTLANGDTGTSLPGAVQLDGLTFSGFDGLTFGAVTLSTSDVALNSNTRNIQAGSVAGAVDLMLMAGVGAGTTTVSGNVSNLGDGTGAALTLESGVTGLARLMGTVTANSGLVAQAATSNVRFDQNVTLGNGDTGTSLPGAVQLDGLTFSGFDGLTFGAVTVSTSDVALNSNASNIVAGSVAGAVDLMLMAGVGAGTTTVTGNVSNLGDGTGAALTLESGVTGLARFMGTVAANSGIAALDDTSSVRFDGNVSIGAGNTGTTLNGNVQLDGLSFDSALDATFGNAAADQILLSSSAVNMNLTADGRALIFQGVVDGAQPLTISGRPTGDVMFMATVGGTAPLTSLDVADADDVAFARVNTMGNIRAVALGTDPTIALSGNLTANSTGNVELTVDGIDAAPDALMIPAVTVQAMSGNVMLRAGDDVTLVNGSSVMASGTITIEGDIGNRLVPASTDSDDAGSNITLNGLLQAQLTTVLGNADTDQVLVAEATGRVDQIIQTDLTVDTRTGGDMLRLNNSADADLDANRLTIFTSSGQTMGDVQNAASGSFFSAMHHANFRNVGRMEVLTGIRDDVTAVQMMPNLDSTRYLLDGGADSGAVISPRDTARVLGIATALLQSRATVSDPGSVAAAGLDIQITGQECLQMFGFPGGQSVFENRTNVGAVLIGSGTAATSPTDTLIGGSAADVIFGRAGQNIIQGGAGNDLIFADLEVAFDANGNLSTDASQYPRLPGSGTADGGPGNDTVVAFSPGTFIRNAETTLANGGVLDVISWLRGQFLTEGDLQSLLNAALATNCFSVIRSGDLVAVPAPTQGPLQAVPLVLAAYQDFLGRTPPNDDPGVVFWTSQLLSGVTVEAMWAGFLGSTEYFALSGSTNAGFIQAVYLELLGRAAGPGDVSFWTAVIASGTSRESVAAAILATPEARNQQITEIYQSLGLPVPGPTDLNRLAIQADFRGGEVYRFAADQVLLGGGIYTNASFSFQYVSGLYQRVLGRAASDAELRFWLTELAASRVTVQDIAASFMNSPEHRTVEVNRLYTDFLGRAPDAGGLAFWTTFLAQGGRLEDVGAGILGSAEYLANAGGTNAGFVQALFIDVLGRSASPSDVTFWVGALAGGMSRTQVARTILGTTEYYDRQVSLYYQLYLKRDPTSDERASLVGALLGGITLEQAQLVILAEADFRL